MTETATQSDPGRGTVVLYNPVAPYFQMPLGILAVGTALQRAGFEVRLVDGRVNRPGDRELTRLLDGAVMAGVGVLSGKPILDAIRFSRQVKELAPDLPVVWGGWHPSLLPEQCLTEGSVDYVIRGPGEESAAALASCLARGAETGEVPGLTRRTAGGSIQTRDVLLPAEPPALDYRLLTMDHYWAPRGSRTLDYITSQGCPFNCAPRSTTTTGGPFRRSGSSRNSGNWWLAMTSSGWPSSTTCSSSNPNAPGPSPRACSACAGQYAGRPLSGRASWRKWMKT